METKPDHPVAAAELRRGAERRLREQHAEGRTARSEAETQRLVHELQVHQIELEMQNEELQRVRSAAEAGLEKFSDLYDFAPVGYVSLDRDGTILEANLAAAALVGIERSRLIQRRLGLLVTPDDLPAFSAFLTRVFQGRGCVSCEVSLLREGGSPVETRIEAAAAATGRECRATLTDITEHRRAEADRLTLGKLESTGILAGGIAHDFNNLLTVILLDLEMVRSVSLPGGEVAQFLEEARQAALSARSLTGQLITFASGGAPVRKPIRLPGLIREAVRPVLGGSRLRCEFSLPDDLWGVEADEGQLGQVLRNLALNAREAMPEGGTLFVRARNVAPGDGGNASLPPGEYVRLSVEDRGTGIASDVLPRIFDPYFSTKQRGSRKGMGLGLTICHTIVQKHDGAISVVSEVGRGTTFHVDLPACRWAPTEPPAPPPRLENPPPEPRNGETHRAIPTRVPGGREHRCDTP